MIDSNVFAVFFQEFEDDDAARKEWNRRNRQARGPEEHWLFDQPWVPLEELQQAGVEVPEEAVTFADFLGNKYICLFQLEPDKCTFIPLVLRTNREMMDAGMSLVEIGVWWLTANTQLDGQKPADLTGKLNEHFRRAVRVAKRS